MYYVTIKEIEHKFKKWYLKYETCRFSDIQFGLDLRFGHNVGAMLVIALLEGEHKVRPYNSVTARIMYSRNKDQGLCIN